MGERTHIHGTSLTFVGTSYQLCHSSYSCEVHVLMSITEMRELKLKEIKQFDPNPFQLGLEP